MALETFWKKRGGKKRIAPCQESNNLDFDTNLDVYLSISFPPWKCLMFFHVTIKTKTKRIVCCRIKKCRRPSVGWLIECFHIKTNTIGILLCVEFDAFCVRAINFPRFSFRQNLILSRRQGKKDLLSRGLLCNDRLINFEHFLSFRSFIPNGGKRGKKRNGWYPLFCLCSYCHSTYWLIFFDFYPFKWPI